MPLEDKATRRLVEREIAKYPIDANLMVVTVLNKVATFKGRVKPLQGGAGRNVDVRDELRKLENALLMLKGINEVVFDVAIDDR
ncbi:MAG: hypothetical protein QM473_04915 [Acidobacteriota bacterium]|nr:hypothetical protein [Acidobacteriota bacterium]